jgi:hypothetical protein
MPVSVPRLLKIIGRIKNDSWDDALKEASSSERSTGRFSYTYRISGDLDIYELTLYGDDDSEGLQTGKMLVEAVQLESKAETRTYKMTKDGFRLSATIYK